MPEETPEVSSQFVGATGTTVPTSVDTTQPLGNDSGNNTQNPAGPSEGNSTSGTVGGNGQAGGNTSTGSGGTTTPTRTPVITLDPVTTATGVSLRMRADTGKCLSRPATSLTGGDKLIVASCASDARQAFAVTAGSFFADANFSIKIPIPNAAVNMTIASGTAQRAALTIARDSTGVCDTRNGSCGYFSTKDKSTAVGAEIVQSSIAETTAVWDMVAVGGTSRGTTLSADGCSTFCLLKTGSTVGLATCDANAASQRWSFVSGCLMNDAGGFLTYDTSQVPPALFVSSASGLCASTQKWTYSSLGFYCAGPDSSQNTTTYVLLGDPSTKKVSLTDRVSNGHAWIFGGTKSLR